MKIIKIEISHEQLRSHQISESYMSIRAQAQYSSATQRDQTNINMQAKTWRDFDC